MANSEGIPPVASAIMGVYSVGIGAAMHELSGSPRAKAMLGPTGYVVAFMGGAWFASSVTRAMDAPIALWDLAGGLLGVLAAAQIRRTVLETRERRSQSPSFDPESRDPGWPLFVFVPFAALFRSTVRRGRASQSVGPPVTPIRFLYLSFTNALLLWWFVLSFIEGAKNRAEPAVGAAAGLVAGLTVVAAIAFILGHRFEDRVVASDATEVLATFRSVLFMRIAVAEAVPLLAVVGTFITRAPWLYPIALVLCAPAWIALAPSARNLQRVDEERRARGNAGSLYEQLVLTPPCG